MAKLILISIHVETLHVSNYFHNSCCLFITFLGKFVKLKKKIFKCNNKKFVLLNLTKCCRKWYWSPKLENQLNIAGSCSKRYQIYENPKSNNSSVSPNDKSSQYSPNEDNSIDENSKKSIVVEKLKNFKNTLICSRLIIYNL